MKPEGWMDLIFGLALLAVSVGLAAVLVMLAVVAAHG